MKYIILAFSLFLSGCFGGAGVLGLIPMVEAERKYNERLTADCHAACEDNGLKPYGNGYGWYRASEDVWFRSTCINEEETEVYGWVDEEDFERKKED